MQINKTDKFNDILEKLFIKLQKEETAIKKFIFDNNELSKTSTQTASELNFTDKCIIKAIKDKSFNDNTNNNKKK